MIVVEHPPLGDRVAELHGAGRDRVLLEVALLSVDALQLSWLSVAVLLAHEDLDLLGQS
jgi:hypothetical protein